MELIEAVKQGDSSGVKRLLERGVFIGQRDEFGASPLMLACHHGHEEILIELLRHSEVNVLAVNDVSFYEPARLR
jgi:ankyrin repeat protein